MLALAALYLAVRPSSEPPPLPDDSLALARRLRAHPADWRAASALSERALDSGRPNRFALWRAAYDAGMRLAPHRDAPRLEFARAALFHWTQLGAGDRRAALDALAPLLRDPGTFYRMARPLFDLTGDLAMLRRWNPGNADALVYLRNTAAMNGRFAEYRELRGEASRKRIAEFRAALPQRTAEEIVAALPEPPYSTDDEPLLRSALGELHRRPLTEDPHQPAKLDALADYALRHRLELDGIDSVARLPGAASERTRYRLAKASGMDAAAFDIRMAADERLDEAPAGWQQLDAGSVKGRSWIDREMSGPASIVIEPVRRDDVPPYVEVYVDDALAAEGEAAAPRAFRVAAKPGVHRLEVRIANPVTRNGDSRLVRVVSVAP